MKSTFPLTLALIAGLSGCQGDATFSNEEAALLANLGVPEDVDEESCAREAIVTFEECMSEVNDERACHERAGFSYGRCALCDSPGEDERERGEDERGEDERGEDERGEDERGEDERGEDERGEDERGEDEGTLEERCERYEAEVLEECLDRGGEEHPCRGRADAASELCLGERECDRDEGERREEE